jgi:hypothetical protein
MRKCLSAFLIVFASVVAPATRADPSLIGVWKSSHDMTMNFIHDNVLLKPETEQFLNQLIGRLALHFDAKHINFDFPDLEMEIKGVKHQMAGFQEQTPYSVLFSNDATVAIQLQYPGSGKKTVQVFNFVDDNTMWVYCCNADMNTPDFHIHAHFREYFTREQ